MNNNQDTKISIKKDSGIGPIIGSIIIVILIVLGGLYFWGYVIKNKSIKQIDPKEIKDNDILNINNELNKSDVNIIDSELQQIDSEIDSNLK